METSVSPRKLFKMLNLYIFWGVMLLTLIPFTLVSSAMKIVGQKTFPDDVFLSIVVTVSAAFNAASRVLWGPLGDSLSFKLPLCINNFFYCALLITFPFVSVVSAAGRYLYAIWMILMFICIGGNFVLLPFGVSRAFGQKYFAINYGIVFTAVVRVFM
ncbi:unnamed protein product [Schistocephalus solidus]|uniref:MFS transporter n=2 Tax=Schistocephalus solidus TaxID=70667 RepID=A0A183SMR6_SCHSO|nr:unnamed protein product [Schistocephalus solidus]